MADAYIVEAVRTPVGKKKGGLASVHPADLGGIALKALIERSGVDPGAVEDVVFGAVDTIGPLAGDIARTCWLVAGLPEHVPGTTVDRQCGSSQQALHFAAQGVMSGTQDLVVAGGVQTMNQIPICGGHACGTRIRVRRPFPWLARLACTLRRPGSLAVPLGGDDRREVGHQPARDGGVRAREQHDGRSRRSTPAASTARSSRSARCAATRRRGAERRSRRWRRSSHSRRVVASPRRCRARSPTARPRS